MSDGYAEISAALKFHYPYNCREDDGNIRLRCFTCASTDVYASGAAVHEVWPCPTVRALTSRVADPGWTFQDEDAPVPLSVQETQP